MDLDGCKQHSPRLESDLAQLSLEALILTHVYVASSTITHKVGILKQKLCLRRDTFFSPPKPKVGAFGFDAYLTVKTDFSRATPLS